MQDQPARASGVFPLLLAISVASGAASAAGVQGTKSTAAESTRDILWSKELGISGPGFQLAFDRSHRIGDHAHAGKPKSPHLVYLGHLLPEPEQIYRFGDIEGESMLIWYRDAVAEHVDRTPLASDTDGLQFNVMSWLSCMIEVTVPLDDDGATEELSGDPLPNDLRVFGALTARF